MMFEVVRLLAIVTAVCSLLSCSGQTSTEELAYVDGGSLVSLSSVIPIPDQLKKDFLDSTLYAQINASAYYDRQRSGSDWYSRYMTILQSIGWNVTWSEFSVIAVDDIIVNWKKTIETVLDKKLSQSQINSLDSVLSAFLRAPAYNGSVQIFNLLSTKGDVSTFQVIPAYLNEGGELVATFGLFNVVEIEQKTVSYNTQATGFIHSTGVGILNLKVYEKYRYQVQTQLSDKLKEYISILKL